MSDANTAATTNNAPAMTTEQNNAAPAGETSGTHTKESKKSGGFFAKLKEHFKCKSGKCKNSDSCKDSTECKADCKPESSAGDKTDGNPAK